MPHPEPQQLGRFMRGESLRDECRLIVRHLLTGCPQCVAITRRFWVLADHPLLRMDKMDIAEPPTQCRKRAAKSERWPSFDPCIER
jgi:hypothetical protein